MKITNYLKVKSNKKEVIKKYVLLTRMLSLLI